MAKLEAHPQHQTASPVWARIRDAVAGQDAIKARRGDYLPQLEGQNSKAYNAYLARATYYNAVDRTVLSMLGEIFRRDPVFRVPEQYEDKLMEIGRAGTPLMVEAKACVEEQITVGRCGLLVDADAEGGAPPYVALYKAEDITDWTFTLLRGRLRLQRVLLREEMPPEQGSRERTTGRFQYRELMLNEDGIYVQHLWTPRKGFKGNMLGDEEFDVSDEFVPTSFGRPLTSIPFVVPGVKSAHPDVQKPILQDLVDLNLAHYRNSADLEHGIHYAALPTPWGVGLPADENGNAPQVKIGPDQFLCADDPNAKFGVLSFAGDLENLENAIKQKENQMMSLGARYLETGRLTAENPVAMKMRYGGEHAALGNIADAASQAWTQVLRIWVQWQGGDPAEVSVKFNKDFSSGRLPARDLTALLKGWKEGLPDHVLYENLIAGEMIHPGVSLDDFRQMLDDAAARRAERQAEMQNTNTGTRPIGQERQQR